MAGSKKRSFHLNFKLAVTLKTCGTFVNFKA